MTNYEDILLDKLGKANGRRDDLQIRNNELIRIVGLMLNLSRRITANHTELTDLALDALQAGRKGKPTHDALDEPPANDDS